MPTSAKIGVALLALMCIGGVESTADHAAAMRPPRRVEVHIADLKFKPREVNIAVGDTVVWINDDDTEHTVKADDGSFGSGRLASGRRFEQKFEHAGKFAYHDDLHPRMHGVLVIGVPESPE